MNPARDPTSPPVPVVPLATPVLNYSRPIARVRWILLVAITIVATLDLLFGVLLMLGVAGIKPPPLWMVPVAAGLLLASISLWTRTPFGWRCSLVCLIFNALLLSLIGLAATLRLWNQREVQVSNDGTMFNIFFGNLIAGLNFAGVYVVSRANHAFRLVDLETRWLQRLGLLFPLPLLVFGTAFVILMKYYP